MEYRINPETSAFEVKEGDAWKPVPPHVLARIEGVSTIKDALRVPGAPPVSVGPNSDKLDKFKSVTHCSPTEWLHSLRVGRIRERGERVSRLYTLACELVGEQPNELDLL